MIPVRELNLGNYVNSDSLTKTFKIDHLSLGTVHLSTELKDDLHEQYYHRLKPIPITLEWLTNLGFDLIESFEEQIDYIHSQTNCYLTIYKFRGMIAKYSFFTELVKEHMSLNVENMKYIHQLQNAFFVLTKKELILNKLEK
ncbi:MAG TPA: hypothetical protein VGE24_03900 [Emticicia sp.]